MIAIFAADADSFASLGMGALSPSSATVEEETAGMYELSLTQPIAEDGRHLLIANGTIIRSPAPVRETPLVEVDSTGTVTRQIYSAYTESGIRLNMRAKPSLTAPILGAYTVGTEVVVTGTSGDWSRVIVLNGGAAGWMWSDNLIFVREETETIVGDEPGAVIEPRLTREQLFRVYNTRRSSTNKTVEVLAQHITYDLKGVIIDSTYAPENVAADAVCAQLMALGSHEHNFTIYCTCEDEITADYTGRSVLDCLLDPNDGVVAQCKARLIRDNFDVFILPDDTRNRGVDLRYAKNLLEAELEYDSADIVTKIRPVGRAKNGSPLYITDNDGYVDSAHILEYAVVYAKQIEYDVQVGANGIADTAAARAKLAELAQADFDAGIDLPVAKMDAGFVQLEMLERYTAYANQYTLHLYDETRVIDPLAGIYATLRMTGYEFDVMRGKYARAEFGEFADIRPTVFGYDLARDAVSLTNVQSKIDALVERVEVLEGA